jgi:predicted Zn-dependent protease
MRTFFYSITLCIWLLPACKKDPKQVNASIDPYSFLSGYDYDKLRVEIQSVSGYEPDAQTINNIHALLITHLNKPAGIEMVKTTIASPGKNLISLDDIRRIESEHRTLYTEGKTLTAYLLFVDADYYENSGNSKVLGLAYGNTSMVVFEKTVRSYSGGLAQPSRVTLESTVGEHEFGHILGLVGRGTPVTSPHQDKPRGAHCINSSCLMYFTAETSDIVANLLGNTIPVLDQNCKNDLKANGGK